MTSLPLECFSFPGENKKQKKKTSFCTAGAVHFLPPRASSGWPPGSITSVQNRQAAGLVLPLFFLAVATSLKAALNFIPRLHSVTAGCVDMKFYLLNAAPIPICDKTQTEENRMNMQNKESAADNHRTNCRTKCMEIQYRT